MGGEVDGVEGCSTALRRTPRPLGDAVAGWEADASAALESVTADDSTRLSFRTHPALGSVVLKVINFSFYTHIQPTSR